MGRAGLDRCRQGSQGRDADGNGGGKGGRDDGQGAGAAAHLGVQ